MSETGKTLYLVSYRYYWDTIVVFLQKFLFSWLSQYFGIISGTGDWSDVLMYLSASLIRILINKRRYDKKKMETKSETLFYSMVGIELSRN